MNILTFDIEDWYHLLDVKATKDEQDWESFEVRIHKNTDRILDLLIAQKKKATFFCLGWVAKQYPELVKKISTSGFEVASHSYSHQLAYTLSPDQFRSDLKKSIDTIEQLTGKKVTIFRAPGFSFTNKNIWVFDILIEAGITTDSSIFPGSRGHGGFSGLTNNSPFQIKTASGTIKELPINLTKILNLSIAFSGGGYFRLLPYSLLRYLFRKTPYIMTYFHPRDFDKDQPVVPGLPIHRKFKSYFGLKHSFNKFEHILSEFEFNDIEAAISRIDWHNVNVHDFSTST
ncbi:MAG: polysaccharide deacetylase family protein [Chitinispirillaceae bacterium]|nr:polysaccharide deacetylase family protein [Chitinispirillaceae bacterium]